MIEFAIIVLLSQRITMKNNSKKNLGKKNKNTKKTIVDSNTKVILGWEKMKIENKRFKLMIPPIHVIDFAAFWVHFLSFLVFNIMYWSNRNQ